TRFSDLRLALEQEHDGGSSDGLGDPAGDGSAERGWLTDMGRFFSLFDDRKLALDIFAVVEDGRLDCRVKYEYPGIAASYVQVQQEALRERPPLKKMPLRQAMVEFLVRLSLQRDRGLPAPVGYLSQARALAAILQRLLTPGATVEDTAEATIRIYRVLSRLPNEELPLEQWQPQDFDQEELSDQELEELLDELRGGAGQDQPSTEGEQYQSPPEVEYRGEFKPEIVQLLSKLRQKQSQRGGEAQGQPLSREMLEQLLKESAELELDTASGELSSSVGLFVNNLMREAGITPPPSSVPGQGYGPFNHEDEQGGPLEAHEPYTYVYDEWDFRAGDYKPRWCIVREKTVEEGDIQFFQETLHSYSSLMEEIRRQFELVVPESFRKIRPLKDGEDLDLDAALEATLDLRTGRTPSEKVYWRRNKVERDVAVVFLLDMSASTAEAIDEGRHYVDDQDAPNDPVEYMLWLRSRREGALRRQYKRIIDIEKESTALLIQALETIGDTYGIYGFSGYGRENVEFYVIKDVEESFTDRVKRRLDKVTPLHATRMGPAIRHATEKLERQDTKTKILFLISDGRPQDRGYSREGVEKEYAIHDTKMALVEARRKSIHPFCLTVDKAGHDYLKAMCGDLGYEVLADIWALPQRLPMLYRRLTV
ncbi:MAG: nitric oxide reductase activation protein NorD, partial [Dehalococcoidia bacterium]